MRSARQARRPKGGDTVNRARRRNGRMPGRGWLLALAAALAAGAGLAVGAYLAQSPAAGTSTSWQMRLSRVPRHRAPDFNLTDQLGRRISLGVLRGKSVALYFMDPRCTDVCPVVAHELVDADRVLGAAASRTALIGIDVNLHATARRWLTKFDAQHGLDRLPNWHFLTGTRHQLQRVWQAYHISVQTDPSTGDVEHTTVIEFIDPAGRARAVSAPYADVHGGHGYLPDGQLSQWGSGIADQLRQMLPEQSGGHPG